MAENIMPVLHLERDKETKDIKMQVLHGLRHCHVNGGERVGRDLQAQRDWWESSQGQGSSGGWTTDFRNNDCGKKLCLKAWPNIRDVKIREEQFPI